VEEWLKGLGTTLWGRAWDVNDPTSRTAAAKWMLDQMESCLAWLTEVPDE
jgi:hypothetical protein